jgi:hypothetical protein
LRLALADRHFQAMLGSSLFWTTKVSWGRRVSVAARRFVASLIHSLTLAGVIAAMISANGGVGTDELLDLGGNVGTTNFLSFNLI